MPSGSSSFLRQLSERNTSSNRWVVNDVEYHNDQHNHDSYYYTGGDMEQVQHHHNNNMYECCGEINNGGGGGGGGGLVMRKRVMVVVDDSAHSKHAMMWALTHVANKGDLFTLLHVVPSHHRLVSERASSDSSSSSSSNSSSSPFLANSLGSLCKACKPEVEVEALVIQGPKMGTVLSQVKKLEVSVLVLGQKKPSSLFTCFCGTISKSEEFVEECINTAECLTIGVRKQSRGVSGYLISTRWQKDFWLLA